MGRTKCKNCGTELKYELEGPVYPGCKEQEEVICPECGTVQFTIMTSQFVITEVETKEDN